MNFAHAAIFAAAAGTAFALSAFPAASADPTSHWFGTAPFCSGEKSDCNDTRENYWLSNDCGDGSCCTSGTKVLCVGVPKEKYTKTKWIGTAPACGGKPADCWAEGMDFIAFGKSGDGKTCATGYKVLCAGPRQK